MRRFADWLAGLLRIMRLMLSAKDLEDHIFDRLRSSLLIRRVYEIHSHSDAPTSSVNHQVVFRIMRLGLQCCCITIAEVLGKARSSHIIFTSHIRVSPGFCHGTSATHYIILRWGAFGLFEPRPRNGLLLDKYSLENRSVSGDFSSQGALRCVVAVAFVSKLQARSFTGKIALATIGLNFALHARRLIAVRQGRGIRMLVLQISCRPRVMRYRSREHGKIEYLHQGHSRSAVCASVWMDGYVRSNTHRIGTEQDPRPRSPFCHRCFAAVRK